VCLKGEMAVTSAENCTACEEFGPGNPLALIICSESELFTVSPDVGTYVAKRLSKDRFSPTITITCLMGVAVLESPLWALPDGSRACARLANSPPILNCITAAATSRERM